MHVTNLCEFVKTGLLIILCDYPARLRRGKVIGRVIVNVLTKNIAKSGGLGT